MAQIFYMPMRGERTAPLFEGTRAQDLPRIFHAQEELCRRAKITDENEKKKQVVYYTDIDTEHVWKCIPEFSEPTSTYADFKHAIMEYYPEAAEFLHSITDIDSLTDERQRTGMTSVQDLQDYHLQLMAITTWLIKKGQLCELGQKRAYIRAFPTPLLPRIITRLQFNFLRHHPAIPYPVTEVYNTAKFLLHGVPSLGFTSQVQPISAPAEPTEFPIKTEALAPIMAEFSKTISKAVKSNQQAVFPIPVQTIKSTYDERIATLEAKIFNLKKARKVEPKPPTVSIPNSEPTVAENVYKRSINAPITITQRELIVTDIQPIYTAEHSNFTIKNTANRFSEEVFISPEPVEIFSNTHKPAEKSDLNTAEPIPPPSDSPANQPTIPSITDNNLPIIKHLPTNSQPADQISIQPTHNPSANITDNSRQTTDNKLSNSKYLPSITDDDLPTMIYIPINTDKCREFTDKQLPTIKYLSTDSKYTVQQPILSNSNRPLVPPAIPILRKFKVFPPDILYISLFTDFDKSPD